MIRSFRCKHTQALYEGRCPARFCQISAAALRKLDMLDAADCLDDVRIPPGNRLEALRGGCDIVTDTQMAKAGINKTILARLGGQVHCFMSDPEVAAEAKERGVTRAVVSMERAAKLDKPCIFAIGNAPTALISLHDQIQAGDLHPALIIGVPVGFVNVVESKEMILPLDVPYIVARGRKGGSNVAAAICNALLYQILR